MNWFKNLRVKTKLLISFMVITAFVVVLALLALFTVNKLDDGYNYVLEYPEKRLRYLSDLDSDLIDMRRLTATLVLNLTNPNTIENYWSQFEKAYSGAITNIDKYVENNKLDKVRDPFELNANVEVALEMKKQIESYKVLADKMIVVARNTHDQNSTNEVIIVGAPIISGVQNTADELVVVAATYMDQISAENTKNKGFSVLIFIIITAVIVLLSIVIALVISHMISEPLQVMSTFLEKAGSSGDIHLRPEDMENIEKMSRVKDELGECITSCSHFVLRVQDISKSLEIVANGDLTDEVVLLSDKDVMGISLQKMIENLNNMFGEINASIAQVSTGASQVAEGAQSIAEGSTDQASSVEELFASISEVADKTKHNTGIAREAAELSTVIKGNAEKGTVQMEEMMQAVQEINEASNQIEKVIKVIDDIAFQTNILALNAAVEAARAGQYGMGFAVVADEVRNLAAKSKSAAQETEGLIANSMKKANQGLSIATETSDSLKDIMEGINGSADIVLQIAQSSDEQAESIMQINAGIDQVAQIVQQNSATAEEFAAASEEMSGQADMLEQMILRFKLKKA